MGNGLSGSCRDEEVRREAQPRQESITIKISKDTKTHTVYNGETKMISYEERPCEKKII